MSLKIKVYPKGQLDENTYLLIDEDTGDKAVIDPGYIGDDVINDIGELESLKYILLTHGHFDHFYCAKEYIDKYKDAEFIAPKNDEYLMNKGNCPKADVFISEGEEIRFGNNKFNFISTPGHTEGSMCILIDNLMFSGDTLFKLSVGNTTFETGNWDNLAKSIREKLYVLDENIVVYPGHGPYTTIGFEKRGNPFV